ncbi:NUDIX domain-containing protein [Streptomyces olindensis]|uniref:NUDIX domain-containing protein n=1 Tax=Streptomyces olindensis TaxID=358823 RepID=UPI0033C3C3F3
MWFNQLAEDLSRELAYEAIDCLVLSGDIAEKAQEGEYDAALLFLNRLIGEFGIDRRHLLITPGNHDVDWMTSQDAYQVMKAADAPARYVSAYRENPRYVEVVTDEAAYARRFARFADFFHQATGSPYPTDPDQQVQVVSPPNVGVTLVGLNSAYTTDHHHPDRSSIRPGAIDSALHLLRTRPEIRDTVKLAVWHHPVRGDGCIQDPSVLERMAVAGFRALLHGHVHKAHSDSFRYDIAPDGRHISIVGAGTFGSPDVHRGYPWQYNILTLSDTGMRVQSRAKSEPSGAWHADARFVESKGAQPVDHYAVTWTRPVAAQVAAAAPAQPVRHAPHLIRTLTALKAHLRDLEYDPTGYRIAVEALIFDRKGRMLLQRRGPASRDEVGKLEGVGGQIGAYEDLIACLQAHIGKEIGGRVRVSVDYLLEARPVRFVERDVEPQDWIVVSYLCRLTAGRPTPTDLQRTESLHWISLDELHHIPDEELSKSTSRARDLYRVKFGTRPFFREIGDLWL